MKWLKRASAIKFFCVFILAAECQAEALKAEAAIQLVDTGTILSLAKIIELHPVLSASQLLDIELEREENGDLIYEFEILKSRNLVVELEINAVTGQLIREEFEE